MPLFSLVKMATKSLIPRQVLPVFGQEKMGKLSTVATHPGQVYSLSVILADVKTL